MMKRFFRYLFFLLFALGGLGLASCLNTSEEVLYPENVSVCDTVPGIYSKDVVRLMESKCTGCHSADGMVLPYLETYTQVSANSAQILERVKKDPSDPLFMPKGGSKLSACELRTLEKWVANGKPQN